MVSVQMQPVTGADNSAHGAADPQVTDQAVSPIGDKINSNTPELAAA
jgi:hypothetical protein